MKDNIQLGIGNMLIASQSYISALDELKGTPYYARDIKVSVDQLLNKIQSRFRKQFKNMFAEENAEVSINMLKEYEKFNKLAVSDKLVVAQMTEYYLEDPEFWHENFIIFFEKLNKKKNE